MYEYEAEVSRVIDGDTVDMAWVDLGFGIRLFPSPTQKLRFRFEYCNAYETTLRGDTTPEQKALGLECKAWLKGEIEGKIVIVRTVRGGDRGNFGRWLAWVWRVGQETVEATSINYEIIERGYGVPYEPS